MCGDWIVNKVKVNLIILCTHDCIRTYRLTSYFYSLTLCEKLKVSSRVLNYR